MQVSHQEVLEGVSSILDDHGFAPTGKGISIGDLEWFDSIQLMLRSQFFINR
jgi:hypothetical protein